MREIHRAVVCSTVCFLLVTTSYAGSSDQNPAPFQDSHSKDVLRAMDGASTWGHPDQEGEYQGILHFAKGDYARAMKYFLDGALYADKVSQMCIGLMYLNGNGVQKNPVTAYAWIAIAAERKYPKFVKTRDELWAQLNPEQRQQATALTEELSLQYGDAVAKSRMKSQLAHDALAGTASHTGYDDGSTNRLATRSGNINDWNSANSCNATSIGGAPIAGCTNIFANDPLKQKTYFGRRDAEWEGTVTVGALKNAVAPTTTQTTRAQPPGEP
jgi:uncharacterized protein